MIYQEGRSTVHSTIHTVGKTNTIAQVKINTEGSSVGVQQSAASLAAAPPAIPPLRAQSKVMMGLLAYGSPVVGFFFARLLNLNFLPGMGWVFACTVVGFILAAMCGDKPTEDEIKRHKLRYREEYAALEVWEQTFGCGSCGQRFIPEHAAEVVA
jgi:hypothetical protein